MPANWQLPPGVSRALWNQMQDSASARSYDGCLADTPLAGLDVQFVLECCPAPGSLIDLGCGTGRLALALARRGYRVVAVDLSPHVLGLLGETAAAHHLDVARVQANLVELDAFADQSFDYAACLFSTLGLIDGLANRQRFLEHVFRVLRPGGLFVLHVHNRWFHLWTRAGRRLLARNFLGGDFMMPAHEGVGSMNMHLFTKREIARTLTRVGFHLRQSRPVGLGPDGKLNYGWLFASWRAYGFLLAAEKCPVRTTNS